MSAVTIALIVVYLLGAVLMALATRRPQHEHWLLARVIVVVVWPVLLLLGLFILIVYRNRVRDYERTVEEHR